METWHWAQVGHSPAQLCPRVVVVLVKGKTVTRVMYYQVKGMLLVELP